MVYLPVVGGIREMGRECFVFVAPSRNQCDLAVPGLASRARSFPLFSAALAALRPSSNNWDNGRVLRV
jgi:hypothetical protein